MAFPEPRYPISPAVPRPHSLPNLFSPTLAQAPPARVKVKANKLLCGPPALRVLSYPRELLNVVYERAFVNIFIPRTEASQKMIWVGRGEGKEHVQDKTQFLGDLSGTESGGRGCN